jgi:hypothetical protein
VPAFRPAVDAMCKACSYDPIGGQGTWRAQVEACHGYSCPLYPLRPRSRPHTRAQEGRSPSTPTLTPPVPDRRSEGEFAQRPWTQP